MPPLTLELPPCRGVRVGFGGGGCREEGSEGGGDGDSAGWRISVNDSGGGAPKSMLGFMEFLIADHRGGGGDQRRGAALTVSGRRAGPEGMAYW
jgi:hypothetical protein